jgi:hypothetical protein
VATLTTGPSGVVLSTNRVVLRNGLGSALITCTGGGDFQLTAAVNDLSATRALTSLGSAPVTEVGGTLSGAATTWTGVIHVTNDVTVPAVHTLTVEPNTFIVIDGVTTGTSAPDLIVRGAVQCLGTAEAPITLTCGTSGRRWGQIRHEQAEPSVYRHTTIALGGRASGEGHTGTGPGLRSVGSTIRFEQCSLTDFADSSGGPGKIMQADDSDIMFANCLLARARMGPEIAGTALGCTNTWIMEMRGPDDADGIYIHSQQAGQTAVLAQCVLAGGDDDGLDTLGSEVTVVDCIIRDWPNPAEDAKGISVFHGTTTVRRSLVVDCTDGIVAKSGGPLARVNLEQCTVVALRRGIAAAYKDNATAGNIDFRATNSVFRAPDAVHSDFGPDKLTLGYCNASTNWPGTGNFTADPLFLNIATNFHLAIESPCVDAGDPTSALDPDWTRADVGAYRVYQPPVAPTLSSIEFGPDQSILLTVGPDLRWASEIQASADLTNWVSLSPLPMTPGPVQWRDANAATHELRFYRVRMPGASLPP